jgi:hypothetical protein
VFWLLSWAASYRALTAVESVIRAFFAGIERRDREAVVAQMLSESARQLSADSLAEDFRGPVDRVAIVNMQTTRQVSAQGPITAVGKVLVRVDYQQGSSADHVFLMAREDGIWKVDGWDEGEAFDMIDYNVE